MYGNGKIIRMGYMAGTLVRLTALHRIDSCHLLFRPFLLLKELFCSFAANCKQIEANNLISLKNGYSNDSFSNIATS